MKKYIIEGQEMRRTELFTRNVIQQVNISTLQCKYCSSLSIVKFGVTETGKQRFICKDCKKTFVDVKTPIGMRHTSDVIASAISMFYEGLSLHKIQRQLQMDYQVMPHHTSILKWIVRYTKKAVKDLESYKPKTGSTWVADETVLKLKSEGGENVWLFDCIDEKTRFLLASHLTAHRYVNDAQTLMEKAEKRAGAIPEIVITDKLRSYLSAIKRTWGGETKHYQSSPFEIGKSTRSVERLHGTIKDRTKVMRAMFNKESARLVMDGWEIHYNFFRPHSGLDGKTPAEAAGIKSLYWSWKDVVVRQ